MFVTAQKLQQVFEERLIRYGVEEELAAKSAANFVQSSMDGVYSHGVNRFSWVIKSIKKGYTKPNNRPECVQSLGAFEQWDGNLGLGNLNAAASMDRAIALAGQYGIGCIALRNTNHWMRAGAYGIQAAKAGCVGICWTNTIPIMPAWGASDPRLGNNPLVFCVPREEDGYVLMDGAMALFSYGALETARLAGKQLPFPGGYDSSGQLTTDPSDIAKTMRVLPMGYWKGSGMAMLLDMITAGLSGGNATIDLGKHPVEHGVSQMFIAIRFPDTSHPLVERILQDVKESQPLEEGGEVFYPSEKTQRIRRENEAKGGVEVNDLVWEKILKL